MGLGGSDGSDHMIEVTGKVMVVAIILVVFLSITFYFCLHLWFWHCRRREQNTTTTWRRRRRRMRRRFDFSGGHQEIIVRETVVDEDEYPSQDHHIGPLHPSVLKSIPVIVFEEEEEDDDGLDCAVCLCEVCAGEKTRVLPKCNHGFHVECIDMWFQSHSTCPLCRTPVVVESSSTNITLVVIDIISNQQPPL